MGEKKKILIVEDEPVFAEIVKERLEREGYSVSIAADAYSGTQQVVKGAPDLIVLDLMMPAGGGFSILERVRNFPDKSAIPVVIFTGKTVDKEMIQKAKELKVSAIFSKPEVRDSFVAKIHSLLSRSDR